MIREEDKNKIKELYFQKMYDYERIVNYFKKRYTYLEIRDFLIKYIIGEDK